MSQNSALVPALDKQPHHRLHPVLAAFAGSEPRHLPAPLISRLQPHEILFYQGDAANHIFEVVEGVIRLYRLLPDGRRAIAGFLYPGGLIGLSSNHRYACTAEAITAARIRRHTRSQIEAAARRHPELSGWLLQHMRDELAAVMNHLLLLGRKNAQERVASFLIAVAQKKTACGRPLSVDLPMSRADIGDYLGLTLETVSRVLAKLKAARLIALPAPHQVLLLQYDALRELAGEDDDEPAAETLTAQNKPWTH